MVDEAPELLPDGLADELPGVLLELPEEEPLDGLMDEDPEPLVSPLDEVPPAVPLPLEPMEELLDGLAPLVPPVVPLELPPDAPAMPLELPLDMPPDEPEVPPEPLAPLMLLPEVPPLAPVLLLPLLPLAVDFCDSIFA